MPPAPDPAAAGAGGAREGDGAASGTPPGRLKKPLPAPPRDPLKAAEPVYGRRFDPWNAVSLGHQRAETAGPQGWRESRTAKLGSQFRAGHSGGARISDSVGGGSEDFDRQLGMLVPKEVRARAANSVLDMLRGPGKGAEARVKPPPPKQSVLSSSFSAPTIPPSSQKPSSSSSPWSDRGPIAERSSADAADPFGYGTPALPPRLGPSTCGEELEAQRKAEDEAREDRRAKPKGIFEGLVIYVNGSMHPHISDHRLKHMLAENGARMAIHLGRRQVTHVIIGRPAGGVGAGAGGGLAAGKLEREIHRLRGCGIKYVDVSWVLESVKAGRRLPEARFASLKIASGGQQSVYGAFSRTTTRPEASPGATTVKQASTTDANRHRQCR